MQLTTDEDYWPAFSADGTKIFFSRDATSDDADANAGSPVDPSDDDVDELWAMSPDGSHAAVVAEGDFEDLAVSPPASSSTGTTTTATKTTTTTTTAGSAGGRVTSVSVSSHGSSYVVSWTGKAPAWKASLTVGKTTVSVRVAGAIHAHTFHLPGATGRVTARVQAV